MKPSSQPCPAQALPTGPNLWLSRPRWSSCALLHLPTTRASRRPASTSQQTAASNVAASSHPRHQTARTHQSGRLWLLLVWRMKTRCPSPSLTASSHLSHPPSALVRHHHMRQAPSRQARSRRKKRSLAGRELASCMARIQPTTRQVAPVSRRTDVVAWNPHHTAIFWLLVLRT